MAVKWLLQKKSRKLIFVKIKQCLSRNYTQQYFKNRIKIQNNRDLHQKSVILKKFQCFQCDVWLKKLNLSLFKVKFKLRNIVCIYNAAKLHPCIKKNYHLV